MLTRLFSLAALAATAAAISTSTSTYAGEIDGCATIAQGIMHCWTPSKVSRDEVKSDLQSAQASGELKVVGELAGSPSAIPGPAEGHSLLTRAEVRRQLADAERRGDVEVGGEIGRTEAEMFPQRYAAQRADTSNRLAKR